MTDDRPGLSPRVLAAVDRFAGERLRRAYVHDPEISAGLRVIERVALAYRLSGDANVTELASPVDLAASLLTTDEVAGLLGVKPGAVRRACREKRLTATKRGREWFITPDAAAAYAVEVRHRR
ncbi:excisionase family DNA binding protein [Actinomadura pelletieri DSM 43383]|uniref:Excisionase family DNA binding protein n=1 Tax=Actinomadura pelletieri DSM 43383 TaxID=1120940 RepID=A0A495QSR1_9ACTN|nr:helix-turn-helix domain-containing protein [Actinomadura pelletieri]RKS76478.1 excisionase family DNA binding protein [Actinomadura pelletieri DSM 43383]